MFTISLKNIVDYKENTLLIHELNNSPYTLTDLDLINRLIENELLLYEADKRGIIATAQEIEEYALFVKNAWNTTEDSITNELFEELAKMKSISVEDYFTHPDTLKQYETTVITNILAIELYTEKILNDDYNIDQYKLDLKNKYLDEIQINESALE